MGSPAPHTDKRARRWPWFLLLGIVTFVVCLRMALMSGPVHRWIKGTIISSVDDTLVPEFSIEDISGDLWSEATLTNIKLTEDGNTVASIDTVHIEYSLLSYFGEAFQIQEVRLSSPFLKASQRRDSTWNLQYWVHSTDADTAVTDSSGSFPFSIRELNLENGRVDVSARHLGKDSSFTLAGLNLYGSFGIGADTYQATINRLGFDLRNSRLDSTLSFEASGRGDNSSVSLEKLTIATAHSLVEASGTASLDDSTAINIAAKALPLGWQDLAAFSNELPIQNDLRLALSLDGNARQFEVTFEAESEGIDAFRMAAGFSNDTTLTLTSFETQADRLNLEVFTGDSAMPALQDLRLKLNGRLSLAQYKKASMSGTLTAKNIRQDSYRLGLLQGNFQLDQGGAQLQLKPSNNGEQLVANITASQIWTEHPQLKIDISGSEINPALWIENEDYSGQLSFSARAQGRGWLPDEDPWEYHLEMTDSRLMGQPLDRLISEGTFNQNQVTNSSHIRVDSSRLKLKAEIRNLREEPSFSYVLNANKLDLADFNGLEEYPSLLTATVEGSGRGLDPEKMTMQAVATIDSSAIRGERIQKISARLQMDEFIATIPEASLQSSIADGSASGRIDLANPYSNGNNLNLNIKIKDPAAFAPAAGVDTLQVTGNIAGRLVPAGPDSAIFKGSVDLKDLNYDNQFIAPVITGGVRLDLAEEPRYIADVEIQSPQVTSVSLKNIQLNTEGRLAEEATEGSFSFSLSGSDGDRIWQAGTYGLYADSIAVQLSDLELSTSLRKLNLQHPFNLSYSKGVLHTDTLYVASDDRSAFMKLAVPYADTTRQKGYLRAERLNLKAIQGAIFNESYIQGMLFSKVHIDRTDTTLTAAAELSMRDLRYEGMRLDTLEFKAAVQNEQLEGMMELHQNGELIAEGSLDIPFKAQKPTQLDEAFFSNPVRGNLDLYAIKLSRFEKLLSQAGYEDTEGILRFHGSLRGQAGKPEMDAAMRLTEARVSDVPIDSFVASVGYEHSQSSLSFNAELTSLAQKALEINARMPLKIDLHRFDVALPAPQDSISADVQTNNFKLKALNDFLDPNTARKLTGEIDGNLSVQGTRGDPKIHGEITLSKGGLRIVPAGIRLDHIASTLQFRPEEVALTNLSMKSGSGTLRASGAIALEELVPGEMDFSLNASNFKVANTDEYNGIINLDMNVAGSPSDPQVEGKLEVISGFVELDNFGEKSVEEVSLDTVRSIEPNISLYDSLSLDMQVAFNRRFFVRNKRYLEMELELDGELDLLKEKGDDLELFGALNTAKGYAEPLGKHFELEEGSLVFSGLPDNPRINIRTLYEPQQSDQDIKIWYIIEGTVEDPQFKYESSPPMDLAGIISYTLFGQPFYKLNPAEQSVANTSSSNVTADFAMEILMDRVESLATKSLGIDVVRIENTRIGGENGTSITTGWYVNPKVFFAIQNVLTGVNPSTGFYLEYFLRENLKLILNQGADNKQGLDIQWEYDY